jgi:hypothetical protein
MGKENDKRFAGDMAVALCASPRLIRIVKGIEK